MYFYPASAHQNDASSSRDVQINKHWDKLSNWIFTMFQYVRPLPLNKLHVQSNIHASLRASNELGVLYDQESGDNSQVWHYMESIPRENEEEKPRPIPLWVCVWERAISYWTSRFLNISSCFWSVFIPSSFSGLAASTSSSPCRGKTFGLNLTSCSLTKKKRKRKLQVVDLVQKADKINSSTYFNTHQFAKFNILVLVSKVKLLPQLGCLGLLLRKEKKRTPKTKSKENVINMASFQKLKKKKINK